MHQANSMFTNLAALRLHVFFSNKTLDMSIRANIFRTATLRTDQIGKALFVIPYVSLWH